MSGAVRAQPVSVTVPAITTEQLSLTIGGVSIVQDLSLTVEAGELLGVIGPNGAGKTTLLNLLSGLARASRGRILLGEVEVTRWSPARRARLGLGRTFQTSSVFPGLSVFENVRLAAQATQGGNRSFWRRADRLATTVATAHDRLTEVGLTRLSDAPAGSLSHGDKRKLELAILLATDPDVILLDEPMAGVSAADVPDLTDLIHRVREQRRSTVVMVEHHMDVVLGLADRIAVMHHGALLSVGAPAAVMTDPDVQSAYLGEPL